MKAVSHAAHVLAEAALGLLIVLALAACVLVWRLAQGPMDVSWLVARERQLLNLGGTTLVVGGADLAWEGFGATGQPLVVRLRGVAVQSPWVQADAAQVSVGLSLSGLASGRLLPGSLAADGANIVLTLPGRAGGDSALRPGWIDGLRHVHIADSGVRLHDAASGRDFAALHIGLDLDRPAGGAVAGTGHAELAAGEAHAALALRASPMQGGTLVAARLSALRPAALAGLAAGLAPLAGIDLPLDLSGSVAFDAALQPVSADAVIAAGQGSVALAKGSVAIAGAAATLHATAGMLRLTELRVALSRRDGGAGPSITGSATATRNGAGLRVQFAAGLDSLPMAELAQYWPPGTRGGARPWLTRNITAGRAHDAHVAGTIEAGAIKAGATKAGPIKAGADFAQPSLTALSGGLDVDDATVWWLRPVPPLVHVSGRVVLDGPDALRVTVTHGGQDRLVLAPGSSLRITGLSARDQFADIAAGLAGPLADALAVLNHPRLGLLSRGGVEVVDPAGDAQAKLTLHVPLEDRVTMDEIPVSATAQLTGVHLGRVVAGRDLDGADLGLTVTGDGLRMAGTGAVAGIAARLGLEMDFRSGGPSQVLQHLTASGRATKAQLAAAGLPAGATGLLTDGSAGLAVEYTQARGNPAVLQVDADLAQAALDVPLGWAKAVGPAATAGARILLDHGALAGVEHLHAEGPGLAIASHAEIVPGQPRALLLDRLELGQTRAAGRVVFPLAASDPVGVSLSGPMLDISAYLKPAPAASTPPPEQAEDEKPGQPWTARLAFDRVTLARGKILAPLQVDAASDGLRVLRADIAAGAPGQLSARIVPEAGGRHLTLQAEDAGAALRAMGVADNLAGGTLLVDARYDDAAPGAPLAGTATLSDFALRSAPAIGRLLQAMTLYGVADVVRGPGLHFSRMVAPFRWQHRVLHLANARAFSASLGFTAQGDIDLRRRMADVTGTVVPAYFFNQLLGNLPLIGRVFSPEKGGGVFAARYSVRGKLGDPHVGINPLAALTPGFLREGFGLLAPSRQGK